MSLRINLGGTLAVALVCLQAAVADDDAKRKFCMQHIEGRHILHDCTWNQGAIQTATCLEVGPNGETAVKNLKSIEMSKWEPVQFGEPGCRDLDEERDRRIRGQDDQQPADERQDQ